MEAATGTLLDNYINQVKEGTEMFEKKSMARGWIMKVTTEGVCSGCAAQLIDLGDVDELAGVTNVDQGLKIIFTLRYNMVDDVADCGFDHE